MVAGVRRNPLGESAAARAAPGGREGVIEQWGNGINRAMEKKSNEIMR